MRTDDGSIIHRCLNGESEAFGILVDKYREGIYAFAYAKLRDFRDAQDVTQEVFVKAYTDLRTLRRWESFSFWLYRIASTRCKLWIRTQSRRIDRDFIEDQAPGILEDSSLESYRASQMGESVWEALDLLPDAYREVLIMHYFGGMSSKEISRAIGISPVAIRVRLNRGRARLREEMLAMMDTAFEGQKLPIGFTFHIVEAIKRIKIHPMPRLAGLPWGLSLAVGIIVTVLSLNPRLSITGDIDIPAGSPLPVESKMRKTGEIPVDILKTDEISVIASKQGNGDGGQPQKPQETFMLAPKRNEGGTWTEKADMPTARTHMGTCVVDGKIYAIGGCKLIGPGFSTVEVYDPKTDTWATKADMPTPRCSLDSVAVNGRIYAIGGLADWTDGPFLSTVEEYNPVADTWTKKADMSAKRAGLSAAALNGKIYAIGGAEWKGGEAYVFHPPEIYDPATDTWTELPHMRFPRLGLSSSAVNGRIYAIGGQLWPGVNDADVCAVVEEFTPEGWRAAISPQGRLTTTWGETKSR
jgi:RNA polymerase sigma factor (sigma-70 family)